MKQLPFEREDGDDLVVHELSAEQVFDLCRGDVVAGAEDNTAHANLEAALLAIKSSPLKVPFNFLAACTDQPVTQMKKLGQLELLELQSLALQLNPFFLPIQEQMRVLMHEALARSRSQATAPDPISSDN